MDCTSLPSICACDLPLLTSRIGSNERFRSCYPRGSVSVKWATPTSSFSTNITNFPLHNWKGTNPLGAVILAAVTVPMFCLCVL